VNKAELWNSIGPRIRDEALLLGPVASRPMWNADVLIPAGTNMTWPDTATGGRGQFVQFRVIYQDGDAPVQRVWAALIATGEDRSGRVVRQMEPFDVREPDAVAHAASLELIDDRLWQWVQAQPVVDS
jgi:hypothetical protein